ncbi:universal stress protein [Propioniciclava sp. MC1683]|uniref:universal stress protein n=1 Tax=Propioniciclava sp. MC1683 TaxID=2760309 RepID=UPI00160162FE|nr:universal stress protein [Propioniciclava sp. MC1683]MBB1500492.1 universal stress protein [Propioniciclava sp. MC1683]
MPISFNATGKIVVGTDLSGRAQEAVAWAAHRAAARKVPLLIVLALPEVPIPRRSRLFDAMVTGDYHGYLAGNAKAKLEELAAKARELHPELEVETVAEEGLGSYVLAQASKKALLVVVGARGANAPAKVRALGGTADAVVAHAHGPVAVITDHGSPTPDGPVVVGVDDSPESDAALALAADEAAARGVPLRAIHAWDVAPWMMGPMGVTAMQSLPPVSRLKERIEEIVAPVVADHPGLEHTVEVVEARPSAALAEASVGASELVVGSRGLGGFTGLLLGSTSKEVLRDADCPVIVTRAKE